ncbi:hypothetical protein AJ78_03298 [Emergomyces pasteurianus Ep9510]|uniref:Dienelactone hydrolase domain-containing protein n=1 Tax=Emergomyces pasteurianus Ep9510 TaxID=1447872 RepID=A0A1J9PJD5_9EURO|nr:hypothetical protein AJ78_03298 [Emergomyces pasteurianus Ep9510]
MASNPPAACCSRGFKHEGTASGEIIKIGDFDAYITHPPTATAKPEKAIIILTDILGLADNTKFVADDYASRGYLTVVPDLFGGKALTMNQFQGLDLRVWLKDYTPETVDPITAATIKYMRETLGVKRIGAVGYCFGAKYATRLLKEGGGANVGYVAHPSFVLPEELEAIKGPYAISAAESDRIFPANLRHESEGILIKTGQPWQINLFSGVEHGFAVRGDLSNKVVKFAKEQAFVQAVTWFNEHL